MSLISSSDSSIGNVATTYAYKNLTTKEKETAGKIWAKISEPNKTQANANRICENILSKRQVETRLNEALKSNHALDSKEIQREIRYFWKSPGLDVGDIKWCGLSQLVNIIWKRIEKAFELKNFNPPEEANVSGHSEVDFPSSQSSSPTPKRSTTVILQEHAAKEKEYNALKAEVKAIKESQAKYDPLNVVLYNQAVEKKGKIKERLSDLNLQIQALMKKRDELESDKTHFQPNPNEADTQYKVYAKSFSEHTDKELAEVQRQLSKITISIKQLNEEDDLNETEISKYQQLNENFEQEKKDLAVKEGTLQKLWKEVKALAEEFNDTAMS